MTREEALNHLNLPPSAVKEEIEQAYQRMVRRYPPEFQPEKFRRVDEAYRSLVSLPFLLEKLLAPGVGGEEVNKSLFSFDLPSPQPAVLEEALLEAKKKFKMSYLWPSADKFPESLNPFSRGAHDMRDSLSPGPNFGREKK